VTARAKRSASSAPRSSASLGNGVTFAWIGSQKQNAPCAVTVVQARRTTIIGLYTNGLDGPGVLSSQGGTYPIGDEQVQFLTGELTRLKPARAAN
jgi:hypothetical protein